MPVFEIPTLPPSVPGMRLFNAFKAALALAGVPLLLDMTAGRWSAKAVARPAWSCLTSARDLTYRADTIILATGGLYGGGITSDYTVNSEAVFDLPLQTPADSMGEWFDAAFLGRGHQIHRAGVRANRAAAGGRRPHRAGERACGRPPAGRLQPAGRRIDRRRLAGDSLPGGVYRGVLRSRMRDAGMAHRVSVRHTSVNEYD